MGYVHAGYTYQNDYGILGNRVGLGLIGATGLVSAISTFLLLIYIMWYTFLSNKHEQPMVQAIRSFTHSALGMFLCSLLVSEMIQGAAFAINFKWAVDGNMYPSLACTAQASVSQFGDLGSALWSIAISYYTFSLLFLVKKPPVWVTWLIFSLGWALIFALPIIGPYVIEKAETSGPFYDVSGAWCWIGNGYQLERFLFVYMWIFISLATSLVLYSLVYLRFSGRLVLQDGKFTWNWSPSTWRSGIFTSGTARETTGSSNPYSTQHITGQRFREADVTDANGVGKHLKTISKRLMLYPLVYSIVTLPVAVCRIGTMAGWTPPFPLYIFAGMAFTSSGLTNVVLFIITRHSLLRKFVSVRPQVLVTTHQVTVLEDSRGVQTIHLRQLHQSQHTEDLDMASDKNVEVYPGPLTSELKAFSVPSTPVVEVLPLVRQV